MQDIKHSSDETDRRRLKKKRKSSSKKSGAEKGKVLNYLSRHTCILKGQKLKILQGQKIMPLAQQLAF